MNLDAIKRARMAIASLSASVTSVQQKVWKERMLDTSARMIPSKDIVILSGKYQVSYLKYGSVMLDTLNNQAAHSTLELMYRDLQPYDMLLIYEHFLKGEYYERKP